MVDIFIHVRTTDGSSDVLKMTNCSAHTRDAIRLQIYTYQVRMCRDVSKVCRDVTKVFNLSGKNEKVVC